MQVIGATTPFFTAFMSYSILRSKESVIVYISLAPVVIGAPLTPPPPTLLGAPTLMAAEVEGGRLLFFSNSCPGTSPLQAAAFDSIDCQNFSRVF